MAELSKWGDNTAVVRYQTSKLQDLKEKQNEKKKALDGLITVPLGKHLNTYNF